VCARVVARRNYADGMRLFWLPDDPRTLDRVGPAVAGARATFAYAGAFAVGIAFGATAATKEMGVWWLIGMFVWLANAVPWAYTMMWERRIGRHREQAAIKALDDLYTDRQQQMN
jgi:hypothetical protein